MIIEKIEEKTRGHSPGKVAMKGLIIVNPIPIVYAIMFTEPKLFGGTLSSAIKEPKFYQPPKLPTKIQLHTYIRTVFNSGKNMKKK